MAHITELPEEIIVMIMRRLDFMSLCNMYVTCRLFRNMLSATGVILECNLSVCTLATANTLKLSLFKSACGHLVQLNMSAIPDLSKTKVLPAFKQLKRLKVLDISHTNLTILDLMAIHSLCPTIKDITIDFKYGLAPAPLSEGTFEQSQLLFEHFENVHFVGSIYNLFQSLLVVYVLKKAKLNTLKFSVVEVENVRSKVFTREYFEDDLPCFNNFALFMLCNWRKKIRQYSNLCRFPVISLIQNAKYEFCAIYTKHASLSPSVYATPSLNNFFIETFGVTPRNLTEFMEDQKSSAAIFVWNKQTTQFDQNFFEKFYKRIKPYFPFYFEALSDDSCPRSCNWIYTHPKPNVAIDADPDNETDNSNFTTKKRTSLMKHIVMLDYDNLLKNMDKAELSLVFTPEKVDSVSLPSNANYFSKITFLSLNGTVQYNADFFNNLFQMCVNLETLSVEMPSLRTRKYSSELVQAIHSSHSMKNLRLVDRELVFKEFFDALSKCKSLENIVLIDLKQWDHCDMADPTLLIQSCTKLYSVYLEGPFSDKAQIRQFQLFNSVKRTCNRPHLRVVVNQVFTTFLYGYDPILDVFKLSSIKPL